MIPEDFRLSIDEDWNVDTRFTIEQILQAWEKDISDLREQTEMTRQLLGKMSEGPWSRLRAKNWKAITDKVSDATSNIEKRLPAK